VSAPIDVARALFARGKSYEAEVIVMGALARDPSDGDARSAALALRRGLGLGPPQRAPELDLALVDAWIRRGYLVEALALLVAHPFADGTRSAEWADLLGELLAPVPAHAAPVFVEMHRQLLRGATTVAMAVLEDHATEEALPPWAARRLALLRWMLLDNAQSADAELPEGEAQDAGPSPLAQALHGALAQRSLAGAHDAASRFAMEHPADVEAAEVRDALYALVDEMSSQGQIDLRGAQTVPVMGRPAAAMQLQMASLQGAASLYRKLSRGQMAVPEARTLLAAVETVLAALAPKVAEKRFPRPRDGFEDATAPLSERAQALVGSPAAQRSGTFEDFEEPTRVADDGELPLDAFHEEETRVVTLPEDDTEHYLEQSDLMDTQRGGMDEAVRQARAELSFDDETVAGAPSSTEMTLIDVDVDVDEARRILAEVTGESVPAAPSPEPPTRRVVPSAAAGTAVHGNVKIARVVKVGS